MLGVAIHLSPLPDFYSWVFFIARVDVQVDTSRVVIVMRRHRSSTYSYDVSCPSVWIHAYLTHIWWGQTLALLSDLNCKSWMEVPIYYHPHAGFCALECLNFTPLWQEMHFLLKCTIPWQYHNSGLLPGRYAKVTVMPQVSAGMCFKDSPAERLEQRNRKPLCLSS
jgi:hypothetical protein